MRREAVCNTHTTMPNEPIVIQFDGNELICGRVEQVTVDNQTNLRRLCVGELGMSNSGRNLIGVVGKNRINFHWKNKCRPTRRFDRIDIGYFVVFDYLNWLHLPLSEGVTRKSLEAISTSFCGKIKRFVRFSTKSSSYDSLWFDRLVPQKLAFIAGNWRHRYSCAEHVVSDLSGISIICRWFKCCFQQQPNPSQSVGRAKHPAQS